MQKRIKTDRLNLRPLEIGDAVAFAKTAANPAIANMTSGFTRPFPVLAAEMQILVWQCHVQSGASFRYVIETKDDQRFCGMVGLTRRDKDWFISYWIAETAWGKGYATEAATAVLREADAYLSETIHAGAFTENTSSAHVLKKLGFAPAQTNTRASTAKPIGVFSVSRQTYVPHSRYIRKATDQDVCHA